MLEGEVPSHAALDLDLRRPADHMGSSLRRVVLCVGRAPSAAAVDFDCVDDCDGGGTGAPRPSKPSKTRARHST